MIRVELVKLLTRPRTWITILALNALPTLVAVLLAVTDLGPRPGTGPPFLSAVLTDGTLFPLAALGIVLPLFLPVAVAVVAHDFADGFNTYTLTRVYGNARRRALTMLFADAAAPVVGAASTLFLTLPEPLLGGYLGLFGGALLYLAAAEILPEAHHEHPARSTLLCTIAGALFVWLVVGAAH